MIKNLLVSIGLVTSLSIRTYSTNAIVTFYDNPNLAVKAKDESGNKYSFNGYGFKKGQKIKLILDNNGTANKKDDILIDVVIMEE